MALPNKRNILTSGLCIPTTNKNITTHPHLLLVAVQPTPSKYLLVNKCFCSIQESHYLPFFLSHGLLVHPLKFHISNRNSVGSTLRRKPSFFGFLGFPNGVLKLVGRVQINHDVPGTWCPAKLDEASRAGEPPWTTVEHPTVFGQGEVIYPWIANWYCWNLVKKLKHFGWLTHTRVIGGVFTIGTGAGFCVSTVPLRNLQVHGAPGLLTDWILAAPRNFLSNLPTMRVAHTQMIAPWHNISSSSSWPKNGLSWTTMLAHFHNCAGPRKAWHLEPIFGGRKIQQMLK